MNPTTDVFVLEQLCHAKEERCRLLRGECLANVEEVHNPSEQSPAFAWLDGRLVEAASFLYDGGFVVVER
jgi:hypothetical protein